MLHCNKGEEQHKSFLKQKKYYLTGKAIHDIQNLFGGSLVNTQRKSSLLSEKQFKIGLFSIILLNRANFYRSFNDTIKAFFTKSYVVLDYDFE